MNLGKETFSIRSNQRDESFHVSYVKLKLNANEKKEKVLSDGTLSFSISNAVIISLQSAPDQCLDLVSKSISKARVIRAIDFQASFRSFAARHLIDKISGFF